MGTRRPKIMVIKCWKVCFDNNEIKENTNCVAKSHLHANLTYDIHLFCKYILVCKIKYSLFESNQLKRLNVERIFQNKTRTICPLFSFDCWPCFSIETSLIPWTYKTYRKIKMKKPKIHLLLKNMDGTTFKTNSRNVKYGENP